MYETNFARKCKICKAEVPFSKRQSGYCTGAPEHWNEAESGWSRPKCECGGDSMKSETNPHPGHTPMCKVYDWEREQ